MFQAKNKTVKDAKPIVPMRNGPHKRVERTNLSNLKIAKAEGISTFIKSQ